MRIEDEAARGLQVRRVRPLIAVVIGLVGALGLLTGLELATTLAAGADSTVLGWMLAHREGMVTPIARAVTNSGTSPVLCPLVAVVAMLVWLRSKRWEPGAAALGVVMVGVLSRLELSKLVADARPPQGDWLAPAQGFSFPSGHAATSALVAGTLAWLLIQVIQPRWARLAVAVVLASWAMLVALSRLYLGVHWVSDIVGSWLLAGAWLGVLVAASRRWELTVRVPATAA